MGLSTSTGDGFFPRGEIPPGGDWQLTMTADPCRFLGMNLNEATMMANQIMRDNLMSERGWRLTWNQRRGAAGVCRYKTREISLSLPITKACDAEEFRETVLHEIAHALAGHGAGHGPEWLKTYRALGGKGGRIVNPRKAMEIAKASARWAAECRVTGENMGYSNRLTDRQRRAVCLCHRAILVWEANS